MPFPSQVLHGNLPRPSHSILMEPIPLQESHFQAGTSVQKAKQTNTIPTITIGTNADCSFLSGIELNGVPHLY